MSLILQTKTTVDNSLLYFFGVEVKCLLYVHTYGLLVMVV